MSQPSEARPQALLARMRGITKRFGRVTVLQNVDLDVHAGEVHILAGENGAGKSTLIKVLAGVHADYEGTVELDGRPVRPATPREASDLGIAVIHQELSLVPSMSVADNLFLGRTPTTVGGFVRGRHQRAAARRLLEQFRLDVDGDDLVGDLSIATQQLIEIAKALGQDAKVIVMDEPSSALNADEVDRLFDLIQELKSRGCGIIYITHKMEEIDRIADRISVLRDGRFVGSAPARALSTPELIRWMVGREVERQFPRHAPELGEQRLLVSDLDVRLGPRQVVRGASFSLRAGEILGLAGLQGSGNSHLLMALFGVYGPRAQGTVRLDGQPFRLGSPRRSIRRGLALLTNDRKATGLVLPLSVIANATLANLARYSPGGWRLPGTEREAAERMSRSLSLRAASLTMEVGELSGGNQQKVALAKWLLTQPQVLLLDEPTRGVDVGAKREIYALMNEWTKQGIGILLVTSEMSELLAMSDRILVMHRGRVTSELTREQATPDRVLEAAMGKQAEASQP